MTNKKTIHNQASSAKEYIKKVGSNTGLIFRLSESDILGESAQTYLGYFINLIQILFATGIYWLIFGYILKIDTGTIPFPLFVLTGLFPWVYFSSIIRDAGNSLIDNKHIIDKIYFPRVILPLSKLLPGAIDFSIALIVSIILCLAFQLSVSWQILTIPIFLFVIIFSGFSIGVWIASLSVKYRDSSRLIPYLINFGFFLTPVFYPSSIIPENISFLFYFNPAAFAIKGLRWAIFNSPAPSVEYLLSLIPMLILCIWGWRNIRKKEKNYADII